MDFMLAFRIGAIISVTVLAVSLVRFSYSLRGLRGKVKQTTFRALMFIGGASLCLGLMIFTSAFFAGTTIQRPWILLFFVFIISSQMNVATTRIVLHRITYLIAIVSIIAVAFISIATPTTASPILISIVLPITFMCSILLSLYLLKHYVNIYSVSALLLNLLLILSWYIVSNDLIGNMVLEPFLLIFMPAVIASATVGSLLRPWRQMVLLTVLFFALIACPSIGIAALLSSTRYEISVFAFGALFVAFSSILSLDYFMREAIDTGARVPRYMSVCLIVAASLAASHTVAFSIVISLGVVGWNLVFVEWFMGLVGIAAFVLCGYYPVLSSGLFVTLRRVLICIVGVLFILGNNYVQGGRWNYQDLVLPTAVVILFGVAGYIKFTRRLSREGAAQSARRFLIFASMPLLFAIAMMLTEDIPFIISISLTLTSGVLLIVSSPVRFTRSATRRGIHTTGMSNNSLAPGD